MDVAWAAETAAESTKGGGGYWQLALVLAGIGFLGLFARWRKARTPVMPSAQEMRERDEEPNRYRNAADKAVVELLETSRVLNAQVDTKIRILNRLVKDAEEHTAKLEALLAEAKALQSDGLQPAPRGRNPDAQPAETSRASARGAAAKAEPERKFMSDLHERIHRLRSEGKSVAEIAKATNLSTTEVEFIVKTL